jgi:hypothetical protein
MSVCGMRAPERHYAAASLVNDYLLELGPAGLGEHDARPER